MTDRTTTTTAAQENARAEALGALEGPCCQPELDPCVTCLVPDDVPYEPTEEDEKWYRGLCREREERLLSERIEAGPTFRETLSQIAEMYGEEDNADLRWLGKQVQKLADRARWLDATSGEQFDERLACHLDAAMEDARRAPWSEISGAMGW